MVLLNLSFLLSDFMEYSFSLFIFLWTEAVNKITNAFIFIQLKLITFFNKHSWSERNPLHNYLKWRQNTITDKLALVLGVLRLDQTTIQRHSSPHSRPSLSTSTGTLTPSPSTNTGYRTQTHEKSCRNTWSPKGFITSESTDEWRVRIKLVAHKLGNDPQQCLQLCVSLFTNIYGTGSAKMWTILLCQQRMPMPKGLPSGFTLGGLAKSSLITECLPEEPKVFGYQAAHL